VSRSQKKKLQLRGVSPIFHPSAARAAPLAFGSRAEIGAGSERPVFENAAQAVADHKPSRRIHRVQGRVAAWAMCEAFGFPGLHPTTSFL
jgi:hypothetical protein